MDDIDRKILAILQRNDKVPYHRIAEELGIGTSTVHFRVKKMVQKGVISRFSAIVDPMKVGYDAIAWVGIHVDPKRLDEVASTLAAFDRVWIVASSSGDHNLVMGMVGENDKEVWKFLNNKVRTIEGVDKDIHVSTVLDRYKWSYAIKL